ncbi:hypothetical protein EON82_02565 [bacterium]|nr:MAG: hypothetical protein EON82_02565 [bacterium]
MSNFAFPTLESLRQVLPQEPRLAEDVAWFAEVQVPSKAAAPSFGWSPPTVDTVIAPTLDLEMERRIAQEEGYRQGFAAGLQSGTERGLSEGRIQGRDEVIAESREEMGAFREALSEAASRVQPAVDRWREEIEERAAELAIEAVRALLAAELATSRPTALGIVREALAHATGATKATIRLAPFDRAELAERRDEILAACVGLRDVELIDDASIQGGCVVETENGVVDATLATRLSLLEAA